MSTSTEPKLPMQAATHRSTSPRSLLRYSAIPSTPSTPALSKPSTSTPPSSSSTPSTPSDAPIMPQTPESPLQERQAHLSPSPLPKRKPLPWAQPSGAFTPDTEDPLVVVNVDTSASPLTGLRYSLPPPMYAPVSETTPSARPPVPARPPAYSPGTASTTPPETTPASQYSPAVDLGVSSNLVLGDSAQEQLPGYASECETEPKTLAGGLWLWGFLCPLLWLIGIWIMYIPLRPVEEEQDVEKAQKLEEMIAILRETELKYARRCARAFTVFAVLLCCAIAIGITVARVRK